MSAERLRDSWSISWCPERCGIRLLFREGEQSETKIVSFGQSTERFLTVNGTTSGGYDGTITTILEWSTEAWTDNQRQALPHGDRRSEIGDRTEWTDPWSIIHSIIGHSLNSFNQSIFPGHVSQGKKEKERGIPWKIRRIGLSVFVIINELSSGKL